MNILLVDGNEKEASDRYRKLGMDTQFQVYENILKKYSNSNINITTIHPAIHDNYLPVGISLNDFEAVAWTGSLLNIYNESKSISNQIELAKELIKLNFILCATKGTAEYIRKHGMKCKIINKVSSGSPHIVDVLDSKKIALVINTGGGNTEHRLNDAIALRRATLKNKVPYCTNMSTAKACLEAIKSLKTKKLEVTSLQDI